MIGHNDLSVSTCEFLKRYDQTIDMIRRYNSTAVIMINSLISIPKDHTVYVSRALKLLNIELRHKCANKSMNMEFANVYKLFLRNHRPGPSLFERECVINQQAAESLVQAWEEKVRTGKLLARK